MSSPLAISLVKEGIRHSYRLWIWFKIMHVLLLSNPPYKYQQNGCKFLIWGWCTCKYQCYNKSYQLSLDFKLLSGATLLQRGHPKRPTNGIISAFIVFITVIGIFPALTGMTFCKKMAPSPQPSAPSKRDTLQVCKGDVGCGVSEGDTILCSPYSPKGEAKISYHSLHGFTTIHFDTDSVFFVCDNSTTGSRGCIDKNISKNLQN